MKKIKPIAGRFYRYVFFVRDFFTFKRLASKYDKRFVPKLSDVQAFLYEKTDHTFFSAHYIYHPAWAARIIAKTKPDFHVDISSTLHFSSILSAFIPTKFYDYRPANLNLSNLESGREDLMSLSFPSCSINSLSCMHTIEHIGLGRYGDKIDPKADMQAISELKRVIAKNGNLLIVVPIGKPKIVFNAHRIYSFDQIISYFGGFELRDFCLIPDGAVKTGLIYNATKKQADIQNYGCGCFWFVKK